MQGQSVGIRPAVLADARQIAEVHVASWRAAYHGLLPQEFLDGLSVSGREAGWRENLANESEPTLVATDDTTGRVVGFAALGACRDDDCDARVGELRAIYLLPTHWDTGLGKRLHAASIDLLAGRFSQATLWVLDRNDRARRFYERRGWHHDGHVKDDERGEVTLTEVRYRRQLP